MCGCNGRNPVYTEDNPLVLGDDTPDEPAVQARATVNILGLKRNTLTWVRGSRLAFYVQRRYIQLV